MLTENNSDNPRLDEIMDDLHIQLKPPDDDETVHSSDENPVFTIPITDKCLNAYNRQIVLGLIRTNTLLEDIRDQESQQEKLQYHHETKTCHRGINETEIAPQRTARAVQTIAYNSHYGITYQYLRFEMEMMDILRHTEANHRYRCYTMIPITLESALKQVQVYEDLPHRLPLKTCYRTSANLSDGSVWSQPSYRFMIYGCIHTNSTLIESVSRNIKYLTIDITNCQNHVFDL
ncbi:hypothetical protein NQ317_010353 [Molorchus minor]|uniref:Uncharacterized protein n=1 Tax=Molorchus minor TaxID=1323400 RepID=A0ABQ9JUZ9_9CUCU|nr:hypothetical protein NQ317_010353 [Molorchus minor]